MLETCLDEYNDFPENERRKVDIKYYPANLTLDVYNHEEWCKETSDNSIVKEDEEEVKKKQESKP